MLEQTNAVLYTYSYDDVMTWKRFLHYRSFVRLSSIDGFGASNEGRVMMGFMFSLFGPIKAFNKQLSFQWCETSHSSCDVIVMLSFMSCVSFEYIEKLYTIFVYSTCL